MRVSWRWGTTRPGTRRARGKRRARSATRLRGCRGTRSDTCGNKHRHRTRPGLRESEALEVGLVHRVEALDHCPGYAPLRLETKIQVGHDRSHGPSARGQSRDCNCRGQGSVQCNVISTNANVSQNGCSRSCAALTRMLWRSGTNTELLMDLYIGSILKRQSI